MSSDSVDTLTRSVALCRTGPPHLRPPNLVDPAGLATAIPDLDDTLPIALRLPPRARAPPKTYTPTLVIEATATEAANTLLCDSVHTRLCSFLDAQDDPNYFLDT